MVSVLILFNRIPTKKSVKLRAPVMVDDVLCGPELGSGAFLFNHPSAYDLFATLELALYKFIYLLTYQRHVKFLTERQQPCSGAKFMRWIASRAASGHEYSRHALPTMLYLRVEKTPNGPNAASKSLLVHLGSRLVTTIL